MQSMTKEHQATEAILATHCLNGAGGGNLLDDVERMIAAACNDDLGHLHFDLDGVPYEIYTDELNKSQIRITATLGYLPFTQEAADKREALLDIIYATRTLPSVEFTLDRLNRIVATAAFKSQDKMSPQFIFHPLTLFQQQAQPFIQIIGNYI